MKHFQSGREFRAKWPSPDECLSLDCALNYMVPQVNSLACWETITNCTRAGLVYLSGFHCHIIDSKQVRQVTEVEEQFKVYVFPSKYCAYTGLFISPSGISELDCATTKTDTAERSISMGRESLQVFCTTGLGVLPDSTARGYS